MMSYKQNRKIRRNGTENRTEGGQSHEKRNRSSHTDGSGTEL